MKEAAIAFAILVGCGTTPYLLGGANWLLYWLL